MESGSAGGHELSPVGLGANKVDVDNRSAKRQKVLADVCAINGVTKQALAKTLRCLKDEGMLTDERLAYCDD